MNSYHTLLTPVCPFAPAEDINLILIYVGVVNIRQASTAKPKELQLWW